MPTYQAKGLECSHEWEYVAPMAACYTVPNCPICSKPGIKEIRSAPKGFVMGKFEQFVSPVDGSVIRTQHDLQEHNARNGVMNIHDGYDEKTVLSGNAGKKSSIELAKEEKERKEELAKDIHTSFKKVEAGYKPQLETQEDD